MSEMAETRSLLWLSCLISMGVGRGSVTVDARIVRRKKNKGDIVRKIDLIVADVKIITCYQLYNVENEFIYTM